MITPAGRECPHYYADFNRHTRDIEECRLAKHNPDSVPWHPKDCAKCPVPDIVLANASQNTRLVLTIKAGFLGWMRRVEVEAICLKNGEKVDPYVGCPDDHPGLDIFRRALDNSDD